tara:strand:- start:63 stop:1640 length:1578 start_codon:yes stop_codon:yes gene_type:complete
MAGYIGSKTSVTIVDGYNKTTADSTFVDATGDTMTGNLNVTGTVTADGLTVEAGTTSKITVSENTGSGTASIDFVATSSYPKTKIVTDIAAGDLYLETLGNDRLKIANNGDISFYEDTGTTEKFFWDSSAESLGIGTAVPAYGIDLSSASGTSKVGSIGVTSQTTNNGLIINSTATNNAAIRNWAVLANSSGYGSFDIRQSAAIGGDATTGDYRLTINSSGNVGIGTSSPSAKLNVVSTGANSRIAIGDTSVGSWATMLMYGGSGKYNFQLAVQTTVNNAFEITPSTAVNGTTFSTPAFVVNSSGNVGIGTSSPSSLLDISSTGVVVSTIRSTSTGGSREAKLRLNVASTGGDDPAGQIEFTYGTGYTAAGSIQMTHDTNNMKFFIGTTERMRIDSVGRVTMPYQPAFRVMDNPYYAGTQLLISFNTTTLNIGNHWNGSNTFTAPIAGLYWFGFTAMVSASTNTSNISIRVNNSIRGNSYAINQSYARHSINTLIYLNAQEYVTLVLEHGGLHGSWDSFSGMLVS